MFGDNYRVPSTPKSHHKSNIPIGNDDTDSTKVANGNGTVNGNGTSAAGANGNGHGVINENGNGNAKPMAANGHSNGTRGKYAFVF